MFQTPILFLIFNRPDTTKLVLDKLREIKPKYLYIAADGPRTSKSKEDIVCENTRKMVLENIDWDCEIKTLFRDENLGCGLAVSSAISWFFQNVDEGIILEDDCLPSNSFFTFCEEMLERYRYNEKIWHISGTWYLNQEINKSVLTKYPFVWGWATWKRSWDKYDFHLFNDSLPEIEKVVYTNLKSKNQTEFWLNYFKILFDKGWNFTWDFQWVYTIWKHNGFTISPTNNLVTNIGFSDDATHTKESNSFLSNYPIQETNKFKINKLGILKLRREKNIFNTYFKGKKNRNTSLNKTIKRALKNTAYNLIKLIIPQISILKKNADWNFIEYSIEDSILGNNVKIYPPAHVSNIKIDNYSYISQNVWMSKTEIGKFCSFGPNLFCGWGIHPTNGISTSPMFYSTEKQNGISLSKTNKIEDRKKIIIGNDVFIGANVTILDGVTIGDGAIIGAGTLVSKDIPAYAIAVGVPVKIIKYRFEPHQIEALLRIKWWDFPEELLKDIESMFFDINDFIKKYDV